jgi:hypothetical protein
MSERKIKEEKKELFMLCTTNRDNMREGRSEIYELHPNKSLITSIL